MPNTLPTPQYDLPGSLFFLLTAQGNNGKDYQARTLITAMVPDGSRPAVTPTLYLWSEASSEGTSGDVLARPDVVPWGVRDLDEAMDALRTVFPEGRPPLTLAEARRAYLASESATRAKNVGASLPTDTSSPMDGWPIRSVAVMTISTLLAGQKTKIREAARDERARKGGSKFTHKRDAAALDLDEKRIAGIAYGPATDFADALSGVATRHRGTLVVVACHAAPAVQIVQVGDKEVREVAVGECPDFGAAKATKPGVVVNAFSRIWNNLHAKANMCWHLFSTAPDLTGADAKSLNSTAVGVRFGAITERGIYPKLGPIMWPKKQGGDGWLGWFADACPRMWHPDVPWIDPETGEDLQAAFTERAHTLPSCRLHPNGPAARYTGGPDAGLLLELCLTDHAARKAGAA